MGIAGYLPSRSLPEESNLTLRGLRSAQRLRCLLRFLFIFRSDDFLLKWKIGTFDFYGLPGHHFRKSMVVIPNFSKKLSAHQCMGVCNSGYFCKTSQFEEYSSLANFNGFLRSAIRSALCLS